MHAAVVHSFGAPPVYDSLPAPRPAADEVLVDVLAAGLHRRVRSQADGSHYTSTGKLPLVPGVDGVGRTQDGKLVYFVLGDATLGSMAEQTVVDRRRVVPLPDDADPVILAAAMNPAMGSWVALRRRITTPPNATVLVLGATGTSGQLAVAVAQHLGAGAVVAVGRNQEVLSRLESGNGTTGRVGQGVTTVRLDDDGLDARLADVASEVDVVLDFLWGEPTARVMTSLVTHRRDDDQPLTWVEVGSLAGPDACLPSAAFRATRLQLVGSGQGSVSTRDLRAELDELARAVADGALPVAARPVPLREVESAWADTDSSERIVLTP